MRREQHLLHSQKSQIAVNADDLIKINLENKNVLLPVGDINKIVNVAERFNEERQGSPYYRLSGVINPMFSNVLFNTTGPNSFETLMNGIFRDRSYPPNGIDLDEEEDLTYKESIAEHLTEVDGWYGYYDPDITKASRCLFYDMMPTRDLFSLTPANKIKNWELTVTYPFENVSVSGDITFNGLYIVSKKPVSISGRIMTAFATPVKHGLTQGATVRLSGLSPIGNDGDYTVIRLGLDDGSMKDYYFCVDMDEATISLSSNPRMKRVFAGEPSSYYFRKFKKIKTRSSEVIENDDYEIYPLAFSNNIFNDKISQFVINEDIDVSELKDNLGRPLSEIFVTLVKTNSTNNFTAVKSGLNIPMINEVEDLLNVPDIRRITNAPTSHTAIENNVTISSNEFIGDVVEYNRYELNEIVLGEIYHRFNTINREAGGLIADPVSSEVINTGKRYEGYIYKPHHAIKIREYSSYIEQGDETVVGIPDYAEDLGDGRFLWRDLLDIGFNDLKETALDYPFLNGTHYINRNIIFPLKRQDPFGKYGLYYGVFPRDIIGDSMPDNYVVKKSEDVC